MTSPATYEPGEWAAVATDDCWLLVGLAADHRLVQRCWSLLSAGAAPEDVFDAMLAFGVRSAPSFAMVCRTPGARRVVVHGSAQVAVAGSDIVTARSARGWVDDDLPAEAVLTLRLSDSAGRGPSHPAPIPPGVTSAATVTVPASPVGETMDLDSPWAAAQTVSIPRAAAEERTVDFSAGPADLPPVFEVPVARVDGPSVIAGRCPVGHLSPPHVPVCRVCGLPLAPQQGFEIARPVLGRLRLSTGDDVVLDRGALFGRAPEIPEGVTERPNVVRLPSPDYDISRTHAVVTLDGWFVHVTDLGSTNGTSVMMPGHHPVRLRPHAEHLLAPGAVVSLADEVSFTFEVTP